MTERGDRRDGVGSQIQKGLKCRAGKKKNRGKGDAFSKAILKAEALYVEEFARREEINLQAGEAHGEKGRVKPTELEKKGEAESWVKKWAQNDCGKRTS